MIGSRGARIAVAVVAVVLVSGSLTGCARGVRTAQPAPAAGVTATTTSPTPVAAPSQSTVQDIQNDLDSADSSVTNAGGDVTDADTSAATNDAP